MNATIFQSYADDVIMIVLAIAYIITFIAQRNTIVTQKDAIEAIKTKLETFEKINNASLSLTQNQSAHIESYQKMVDISQIETFTNIKATAMLQDLLANETVIMEKFKEIGESIMNQELLNQNVEYIQYIRFLVIETYRFDKAGLEVFVDNFFPKNKKMLLNVFSKLDQFEKQKSLS